MCAVAEENSVFLKDNFLTYLNLKNNQQDELIKLFSEQASLTLTDFYSDCPTVRICRIACTGDMAKPVVVEFVCLFIVSSFFLFFFLFVCLFVCCCFLFVFVFLFLFYLGGIFCLFTMVDFFH